MVAYSKKKQSGLGQEEGIGMDYYEFTAWEFVRSDCRGKMMVSL